MMKNKPKAAPKMTAKKAKKATKNKNLKSYEDDGHKINFEKLHNSLYSPY